MFIVFYYDVKRLFHRWTYHLTKTRFYFKKYIIISLSLYTHTHGENYIVTSGKNTIYFAYMRFFNFLFYNK